MIQGCFRHSILAANEDLSNWRQREPVVTLLKLWVLGTVACLAGLMIWAFAPILILIFAITAGLGLLVFVIVSAARQLEARRAGKGK